MTRKLVPWIAASMAIGLSVVGVTAGDATSERPRAWTVWVGDESGSGRAWLGVSVEEETERAQGGARVLQVIPDSPAQAVGLQKGDVIVSVDGKAVYGPRGLSHALGSFEPGDTIEVAIVRDGHDQALSVDLEERPVARGFFRSVAPSADDAGKGNWRFQLGSAGLFGQRPRLGVRLVDVTPELREHLGGQPDAGVLVGQVMKGMPAEMAGIQVGDLIEAVDGKPIEDASDLVEAIQDAEHGLLRIDIVRNGRSQSIDVVLPDPAERDEPSGPRA